MGKRSRESSLARPQRRLIDQKARHWPRRPDRQRRSATMAGKSCSRCAISTGRDPFALATAAAARSVPTANAIDLNQIDGRQSVCWPRSASWRAGGALQPRDPAGRRLWRRPALERRKPGSETAGRRPAAGGRRAAAAGESVPPITSSGVHPARARVASLSIASENRAAANRARTKQCLAPPTFRPPARHWARQVSTHYDRDRRRRFMVIDKLPMKTEPARVCRRRGDGRRQSATAIRPGWNDPILSGAALIVVPAESANLRVARLPAAAAGTRVARRQQITIGSMRDGRALARPGRR
jgi:hypothetical protein